MTRSVRTACLAVACMVLVGCNTVQGMGKDIEKGGAAIQRAVKK